MKKLDTDVLIVGAGPVGLFCVFELGQLNIKSCIVDSLDEIGGQCAALYPEKPIYDIPAYPKISGKDLIEKLKKQISPFKPSFFLNQIVESFKEEKSHFVIETSAKNRISAKCIIIAAGNGMFGPNKPPLQNISKFEGKSVFYSINDKSIFKDKKIAIAGGGDSAADWAIELSKTSKMVYFIHRRPKLRAAPSSVNKLKELEKKGKIEMIIPYQLDSLEGNDGFIEKIILKNFNNEKKYLKVDYFLPFFGLSSNLGPLKEWELNIEKNLLNINQSTCQTSKEGIFAVGDICDYPGKLKLILTGFSEAAIAAHSCRKKIYPNEILHFEYSTTKGVSGF